jgi:serine protease Do
MRVNNTDITNVKSYNDAVARLDTKKPVALLIRDENGTRFITLKEND